MFDGIDRGLGNGFTGDYCQLTIIDAQHGIEMFFDGLDIAVEHTAEVGYLLLGKIDETDGTFQGLACQLSFQGVVQRLRDFDIDELPDQFIRAGEVDDPIVLGSA